jgi:hypothetical protein
MDFLPLFPNSATLCKSEANSRDDIRSAARVILVRPPRGLAKRTHSWGYPVLSFSQGIVPVKEVAGRSRTKASATGSRGYNVSEAADRCVRLRPKWTHVQSGNEPDTPRPDGAGLTRHGGRARLSAATRRRCPDWAGLTRAGGRTRRSAATCARCSHLSAFSFGRPAPCPQSQALYAKP